MFSLNDKEIAGRLKEIMADKRIKSNRSYALLIDADPSFFSKILKGEKSITDKYVKELAKKWLVNENWLLYGNGPKYGPSVPHETGDNNVDRTADLIASLKRENKRLEELLAMSSGEMRHNQLLGRAILEVNQELLIEILSKQRKQNREQVVLETNKANFERYKKLKEEGNFPYEGK